MMVHVKQKAWMRYISSKKAMTDVLFYSRSMSASLPIKAITLTIYLQESFFHRLTLDMNAYHFPLWHGVHDNSTSYAPATTQLHPALTCRHKHIHTRQPPTSHPHPLAPTFPFSALFPEARRPAACEPMDAATRRPRD
jgi:hypothetical protein